MVPGTSGTGRPQDDDRGARTQVTHRALAIGYRRRNPDGRHIAPDELNTLQGA